MPWKQITPMEEIIRFVTLANSGRFTVTGGGKTGSGNMSSS
jgi:hypothetical protein